MSVDSPGGKKKLNKDFIRITQKKDTNIETTNKERSFWKHMYTSLCGCESSH